MHKSNLTKLYFWLAVPLVACILGILGFVIGISYASYRAIDSDLAESEKYQFNGWSAIALSESGFLYRQVRGLVGMPPELGEYFFAAEDNTGDQLNVSCTYELQGRSLPTGLLIVEAVAFNPFNSVSGISHSSFSEVEVSAPYTWVLSATGLVDSTDSGSEGTDISLALGMLEVGDFQPLEDVDILLVARIFGSNIQLTNEGSRQALANYLPTIHKVACQ